MSEQRNAESVATYEGWTTWIPFNLMECHRCSALVLHQRLAMENHEAWHAQYDGSSDA